MNTRLALLSGSCSKLQISKWAFTGMLAGVLLHASTCSSRADERMFTYNYEASAVLPKGGMEFEQWITYKGGKDEGVFAQWDLREELEYGVTDRYTTALYLNFRNTHSDGVPGVEDESEFEFKGISSEHKVQLVNPHTKPVGVLLYGEVTTDGEELELEEKLVLQKFIGDHWNLVLNATLEEEWEFEADETEKELKLELSAGVSFKLNSNWSVGVEGWHVREFEGLSFGNELANAWYVGPNVHFGTATWWATLSIMPQVSGRPETDSALNLGDFERVQVRLIAGINF